jgi:peptidyl-prolyl cis-trans isomerase SurA
MLRPAGAFYAAGLLFAAGLFAADRPVPQTHVVEEIVAKVNGKIITRGELEKQRESIEGDLKQQGLTGEALQKASNARIADGLRDQVDQLLLVAKGKELSINVDADVNRRIAEIQSNSKIADPEKFHEWLHEQSGETFEDFKQLMTDKLLTERVISEEVYRNVNIPKADIEKYYNEHKSEFIRQEMVQLREILVSVGDGTPDKVTAAEKKAKNIFDRIKKGDAKFNDMARQYSDAPTATADGALGAFKRGDLAKDIDDVVFKQNNKGFVTDPIRRPAGFEIYRVEEHYPAGQASLDEVQQDIQNKLMEPVVGPKVRVYLTQLRENAFLQIKPGYVDSGAAPGKDTSWQDATQLKPETTTKENVAAHGHKKLLHVIPYGHVGKAAESSPAPPPATTPVPQTPAPVTPQ